MTRPKLYLMEGSVPVRAVLITAAAIGLDLEKEYLNILKGDQFKPEYLKLNPQHTVPTLVDGDYVLWESHAIVPYLVSKYAADDSLYPRDLQKRGTIDSRLHYDSSVLFRIIKEIGRSVFIEKKGFFSEQLRRDAEEAFSLLNTLLEKSQFAAGDEVTIADFFWVASVSTLNIYVPVDEAKWPHLARWFEKIKQLPCYSANKKGLAEYEEVAKTYLK